MTASVDNAEEKPAANSSRRRAGYVLTARRRIVFFGRLNGRKLDDLAHEPGICRQAVQQIYNRFTFTSDTAQSAAEVPRARAPGSVVVQHVDWLRAAVGPVHS